MDHDERKRARTYDEWKSKPRDMPRLSGDGVERGEDDDGVVHDMVSNGLNSDGSLYAFYCRQSIRVYRNNAEEDDVYEEVRHFTHGQALTLETSRPVNCFLCLTRQ